MKCHKFLSLFVYFLSCSLFSYSLSSTKLQALVQATFLHPSVEEHLFLLSSRSVNFSPPPWSHTWSFKPTETAPRCLLTAYYHSPISCLCWPLCDLPLHRVSSRCRRFPVTRLGVGAEWRELPVDTTRNRRRPSTSHKLMWSVIRWTLPCAPNASRPRE